MEQLKNPVVEAHEGDDDLVDSSSSSSSLSGISSGSSMDSDSSEDVTSNATPSSSSDHPAAEPLSNMSALFQQLPIKKGLSRHYEGKSRSFTSLVGVRSLEDLVKPENAYSKKLKSCRRSYGGGLCSPINAMSRQICKKGCHSSSRSLCCSSSSSMSARRNSVNCMSSRPPIPPHRSTTMSNQTALFA